MNLEARKIEFIQEFLKIQSEEVIIRLEKLLQKEKSASAGTIKPLTFEELNSRIDQSIEDSKGGKLINSDDLKVVIDKWN